MAKSKDLDSDKNRTLKSFDNNSYSIVKRELNKSPKMANYIQEVYDANSYRS